jgi:predicted N-acetyltransferase YhbS
MTARDLNAVAQIFEADTGAAPPAGFREHLSALVKSGGAVFVAQSDREVVGYVAGEIRSWEFGSPPAGWVFALAVKPSWQRFGTGRALLAQAVAALRKAGVRAVRTMVSREDVAVLRFFRREGFVAGPYTELELTFGGRAR